MINSKEDFLDYLKEDRKALNYPNRCCITWKYLKALRGAEYHTNMGGYYINSSENIIDIAYTS